MTRMAEVAVRTNRFAALRPAISSRPGANSGSKCNEECREREKKAFQFSRSERLQTSNASSSIWVLDRGICQRSGGDDRKRPMTSERESGAHPHRPDDCPMALFLGGKNRLV
jgi:hypothetical protein